MAGNSTEAVPPARAQVRHVSPGSPAAAEWLCGACGAADECASVLDGSENLRVEDSNLTPAQGGVAYVRCEPNGDPRVGGFRYSGMGGASTMTRRGNKVRLEYDDGRVWTCVWARNIKSPGDTTPWAARRVFPPTRVSPSPRETKSERHGKVPIM